MTNMIILNTGSLRLRKPRISRPESLLSLCIVQRAMTFTGLTFFLFPLRVNIRDSVETYALCFATNKRFSFYFMYLNENKSENRLDL